jgi:hypothetical protein
MKVLFLDIDGVLIPGRCYLMANQTKSLVTVFDPSVVGMLNAIAEEKGYKFVIHSSWLRSAFKPEISGPNTKNHMVSQGLKEEYFHEDHSCRYKISGDRWKAISDWLVDHPEVTDYWVLEDEPFPKYYNDVLNKNRVITTDFEEGLTWQQFLKIRQGD